MLLEKALDKNFWSKVRTDSAYEDLVKNVIESYKEVRFDEIPVLPYHSRIRFYAADDGDRREFELGYFRRRNCLTATTLLALIYPEEQHYITELQDLIWAICDEYSWVLPAHCNGTLSGDLNHIDLFNAETAKAIAETCYVLADRLDERVRLRAEVEINRRIVQNYEKGHFHWEDLPTNWAAVCAGNVGMAMMYVCPDKFREQLPRLLETMKCFLSGFPEDGTCIEGFSYWEFGFGSYIYFADLLYQFTDGVTDILQGDKILKICNYVQRSILTGGSSLSFSDASPYAKTALDLQHYLVHKFPGLVPLLPMHLMNKKVSLRTFLYYDPSIPTDQELQPGTFVLPDANQVIHRNHAYSLAVKAGHNNEPHGHNDVGNFIFSTEQGQILCDYGAGRYCRQYFGPERNDFLVVSSFGHNVPIIDGQPQKPGKQYRGTITHEDNRITVKMADAYVIEGCHDITRTFTYLDRSVILEDSFDTELPVTERFVSLIQPEVFHDHIAVGNAVLRFDPSVVTVTVHAETVDGNRNPVGVYDTLYCMDLNLNMGIKNITFEIMVRDR